MNFLNPLQGLEAPHPTRRRLVLTKESVFPFSNTVEYGSRYTTRQAQNGQSEPPASTHQWPPIPHFHRHYLKKPTNPRTAMARGDPCSAKKKSNAATAMAAIDMQGQISQQLSQPGAAASKMDHLRNMRMVKKAQAKAALATLRERQLRVKQQQLQTQHEQERQRTKGLVNSMRLELEETRRLLQEERAVIAGLQATLSRVKGETVAKLAKMRDRRRFFTCQNEESKDDPELVAYSGNDSQRGDNDGLWVHSDESNYNRKHDYGAAQEIQCIETTPSWAESTASTEATTVSSESFLAEDQATLMLTNQAKLATSIAASTATAPASTAMTNKITDAAAAAATGIVHRAGATTNPAVVVSHASLRFRILRRMRQTRLQNSHPLTSQIKRQRGHQNKAMSLAMSPSSVLADSKEEDFPFDEIEENEEKQPKANAAVVSFPVTRISFLRESWPFDE